MKKTTKRNGFTVVELVIVIAVIAVLAGVMIPVFSGVLDTANRSNDTSLVANINTILAVEEVLSGGVNDAVEVQKIVKENGLELETKTKGQYLWYDIKDKTVVLGGLDENGIVINGASVNDPEYSAKGKYKAASCPEDFIEGYLFISETSADGLADKIYALRNPAGNDDDGIKASLQETLKALGEMQNVSGSAQVSQQMSGLMATTAVMTENGIGYIGENKAAVIRVIVSSEVETITPESLTALTGDYSQVKYVCFHSGVTDISNDPEQKVDGKTALDLVKEKTAISFFYSSDEIKKIDTNPDIPNLIEYGEFSKHFTSVVLVDQVTGAKTPVFDIPTGDITFTYAGLTYEYKAGTADKAYNFLGYSLYPNGANPLPLCSNADDVKTYTLTSEEQTLIKYDAETQKEVLTIYKAYEVVVPDFKVGDNYYGSATVTHMLANLVEDDAGNKKLPVSGNVITVISTDAKLGDSENTTLTIPSGVELLLPFKDNAKQDKTNIIDDGDFATNEMDFAGGTGTTQLTVAENVTLKVESGASIYVDAQLLFDSTPKQCYVGKDRCGVLVLNGKIESSGNITALGVIRGSGELVAKAGTVEEVFTILDFCGGTAATACISNDATPFNNWRVQNIRAKMTIHSGVKYSAFGSARVSNSSHKIDFVLLSSKTDDKPLFLMDSGSIVEKTYDDGYNLAIVAGTVKDCEKEVDVSVATVNFKKIAMPLPNFDVTVKAGAKLELSNNKYKVLPGSEIVVEEGKEGKDPGELVIKTPVAFFDTFDLKMIKTYKQGEVVWVTIARYTLQACTYDENLQKFSVTYKGTISSAATTSCSVTQYPIPVGHEKTVLTVNGKVVFGNGAVFTGDIESTAGGAIIEVQSGAKFENKKTITDVDGTQHPIHGFAEGVAWAISVVGKLPAPQFQQTYAVGVDRTGTFRLGGSIDTGVQQIPTDAATYTYNGSVWMPPSPPSGGSAS